MKITLFTSNSSRHVYLVELLKNYCDNLYVIQECKSIKKPKGSYRDQDNDLLKQYFNNVDKAQTKLFKNNYFSDLNKKIKILSMQYGDLSNFDLNLINEFLKSDIYIVFGASYIKGFLAEYLIKNNAINIHAGVTPYYRGSDCNFWALYDNNPHLVGSTIHKLSKGLDDGPVLYHAMSKVKSNPFEYTMSTVKSAFLSVAEKIKNESLFSLTPKNQDITQEIRYTKKSDFSSDILQNYFKKSIDLNSKDFDEALLKDPFFL